MVPAIGVPGTGVPEIIMTGIGAIDSGTIALVAVTYVLAGIVKGVTGLGIPIIGVALVAPVLGMQTAVAVLLVPSIATNLWQAVIGGAFTVILRRLWPMLVTACIGIWFGSGILAAADGRFLILFFGVFLIVYTTIALIKAKLPSPGAWEPWLTPVMGAAGGVVFGMTGSFMVPGTIYIQSLGMSRDQFGAGAGHRIRDGQFGVDGGAGATGDVVAETGGALGWRFAADHCRYGSRSEAAAGADRGAVHTFGTGGHYDRRFLHGRARRVWSVTGKAGTAGMTGNGWPGCRDGCRLRR